MTTETDREPESTADSTPPEGDFFRGGGANTTATRNPTELTARIGSVPNWYAGGVYAAGLLLGGIVAWSTWASPAFGTGIAVLAGVAIFAATVLAVQFGWILGVER